jgi:rod shape-determining protein MreC
MFYLRKYKTAIFIAGLLVLAMVIFFYNLKHETEGGFFRKAVLEAVAPVQEVLSASMTSIKEAWQRYLLLVGIQQENENLKKKVDEFKSTLILYQEGYLEAQRLRKLLELKDSHDYKFIAARVIGREQAALSKTILIDKGATDGLRADMPVLAPPGLIGRLVDVSWHASKVLLFIDENSNVGAIVQRTREQGIISGAGPRGLILRYISKTQDVKEGDIVVSSGMGGVFPKGMLIGQVSRVDRQDPGLFLKINVAPFADFSKLEEVLILTSEETKIK